MLRTLPFTTIGDVARHVPELHVYWPASYATRRLDAGDQAIAGRAFATARFRCTGTRPLTAVRAAPGRVEGEPQACTPPKPRRRAQSVAHRAERTAVMAPNEVWSKDFVSDALFDGRRMRSLTLLGVHAREAPAIELDQGIKGEQVVAVLDAVATVRGAPRSIRVDNGPEFVSNALDRWPYDHGVILDFSRPGKPTDNAFVESINGRLREECLNANCFLSLDEARGKIEAGRTFYNESPPQSALGDRTPSEFARQAGVNPGLSGASEAGKLT